MNKKINLIGIIYINKWRKLSNIKTIGYLNDLKKILLRENIDSKIMIFNTGSQSTKSRYMISELLDEYEYFKCDNNFLDYSGYLKALNQIKNQPNSFNFMINDTVPSKRNYDKNLIAQIIKGYLNSSYNFDVLSRLDHYIGLRKGKITYDEIKLLDSEASKWYSSHIFIFSGISSQIILKGIKKAISFKEDLYLAKIDPLIYKRIYNWINQKGFFKWSLDRRLKSSKIMKSKVLVCYLELYLFVYLRKSNLKLAKLNLLMLTLNKFLNLQIFNFTKRLIYILLKKFYYFLVSDI